MNEWIETTERYICFIDVMGFTNYVYRNSHQVVNKRMQKLHDILKNSIDTVYKITEEHDNTIEPFKSVIFSDSILLISKDKSSISLDIILYASQIVTTEFLKNRIPIKGAVSFGNVTADFKKSLFFGKAFIDAYKLQDELYMYGIVLDHKVEKKLSSLKNKSFYCIKSKTPTKSGLISHYNINWPLWSYLTNEKSVNSNHDEYDLREKLKLLNYDDSISIMENFYKDMSGHPRKYIDNTMDFINSL